MNALWRAEAKSNCARFGVIGLPCRNIEALTEQGLRSPGALVLYPRMYTSPFQTPQATSVSSASAGSNQPVMPSGKASKSSGR